jgi:hypothetical protein
MKQKFTLFLLFATILANAQQKPSQQWLDQKYSMFIHFGLYSVYGGVYNGQPVRRVLKCSISIYYLVLTFDIHCLKKHQGAITCRCSLWFLQKG